MRAFIIKLILALLLPVTANGQDVQVYAGYGSGAPMIRPFDRLNRDVSFVPTTISLGYRSRVMPDWQMGLELFYQLDRLSPGSFSPVVTILPLDGTSYTPTAHVGLMMAGDYLIRDDRLSVTGGVAAGISLLSHYGSYLFLPVQVNARVSYNLTQQLGLYVSPKFMLWPSLNFGQWKYFSPVHLGFFGDVGLSFRFELD